MLLGHFKKGHSDKGHKVDKKGDEEEKKTKFFDEDGDEAHDEKKGNICQPIQLYQMTWLQMIYCYKKKKIDWQF